MNTFGLVFVDIISLTHLRIQAIDLTGETNDNDIKRARTLHKPNYYGYSKPSTTNQAIKAESSTTNQGTVGDSPAINQGKWKVGSTFALKTGSWDGEVLEKREGDMVLTRYSQLGMWWEELKPNVEVGQIVKKDIWYESEITKIYAKGGKYKVVLSGGDYVRKTEEELDADLEAGEIVFLDKKKDSKEKAVEEEEDSNEEEEEGEERRSKSARKGEGIELQYVTFLSPRLTNPPKLDEEPEELSSDGSDEDFETCGKVKKGVKRKISSNSRKSCCGKCGNCRAKNCGVCHNCKNPALKKKCMRRVCQFMGYWHH